MCADFDTDEYNAVEIRAYFERSQIMNGKQITRCDLPRLFPLLGVPVTLELIDGRRLLARLVETGQGIRWVHDGDESRGLDGESWGQWSPEVRAWELG